MVTSNFGEKITGLSRALFVFPRAKIRNCHGHFCKFANIVTATFRFSRAFFWLFCHGQLVNFHGQNLGFFVTGIFSKSRALFQKVSRANRKMSRGIKKNTSLRRLVKSKISSGLGRLSCLHYFYTVFPLGRWS